MSLAELVPAVAFEAMGNGSQRCAKQKLNCNENKIIENNENNFFIFFFCFPKMGKIIKIYLI